MDPVKSAFCVFILATGLFFTGCERTLDINRNGANMKNLSSPMAPEEKRLAANEKRSKGDEAFPQSIVTTNPKVPQVVEINLAAANTPTPLRFEKDDLLKFWVWGHPELTHVAKIQENGMVTLPLIGEIQAADKTINELREDIQARFRKNIDVTPLRIKREDLLKMAVWRHPELTHKAMVQPDGMITLPLVGEIKAVGKTLKELREEVQGHLETYLNDVPQVSILPEMLDKQTIPNPKVSILPEKLRERQVAILGEVLRPGLLAIHGHLRAIDAIASAGYKDTAALNHIIVIREPNSLEPQYRVLRLKDFIKAKATDQNIYLQSDDIIMVPKTAIAKIDEFIDKFFTRTKPVFDWWVSLQRARFAEDLFDDITESVASDIISN